nr:immunoglobulin heavy chain junction region [Macaca mulatta]MOW99355.1 immunoglobulin heavy chain junction region [Macaca mulatta]MOW99691.1 immunoglobulin heavy chain junction region [Macaca mulatta]MOW99760.1 immunoglobulin heavy chain junction region [Macaca mulatta]MOX00489.1 immunoglobulin heavy chain junction region [Macaca mulatta]
CARKPLGYGTSYYTTFTHFDYW